MKCPRCGEEMMFDELEIGLGYVECFECGWNEKDRLLEILK